MLRSLQKDEKDGEELWGWKDKNARAKVIIDSFIVSQKMFYTFRLFSYNVQKYVK